MSHPLLRVENVAKQYQRGVFHKTTTFSLNADFEVHKPCVVGVMGPNGSGKTTLFELITGSNLPSAGRVLVNGQDIHQVRTRERDRLAIHYHQSYQVRSFQKTKPDFMLAHARERFAAGAFVRRTAVQHAGRLHRLHAGFLRQAQGQRPAGVFMPAPQ
jgi:ABC-type branched-subunit amino acid transport system ATPase component